VLERVLKKFGKWNTGNVSSEGESDEEGERLEVDGWGVYTDDADHNCKCTYGSIGDS
jgi:mitogen-activated protein kinase kinase kinase